MDLLSATVNQKQRIFTDQLSLTKAIEMPSADMKTQIHPRDFFSLLYKMNAVVKGEIRQNKAKNQTKI